MEPAVQGAIIGACAVAVGVMTTGFIQWRLKLGEEDRRAQEAAELAIFYNRRLRRVLHDFSQEQNLSTNLALGISINDDDISDMEYVLKELSTKIPQLNLILFDVRRHLKNIQIYTEQYRRLICELREGCGRENDLPVILGWIQIDAKNGSIKSHEAIQLAFKLLTYERRKKIVQAITKDKAYCSKD